MKLAVEMRKTYRHPHDESCITYLATLATAQAAATQTSSTTTDSHGKSPQHQSHPLSHPVPNRCPNPEELPDQPNGRTNLRDATRAKLQASTGRHAYPSSVQPHPAICNSGEKQTTFVRDRDYRIERLGSGKRGNKHRRLEVSSRRGIDAQA